MSHDLSQRAFEMSTIKIREDGIVGTLGVPDGDGSFPGVSGGDDEVWATGRMCEMVVNRMAQHGRTGDVRHVHYPQAGHMLFP